MASMKGMAFPSAHLRAALPPDQYAEQIFAIERELDQLHPPWKQPARSRMGRGIVGSKGITDPERKARVKYLLQRRKYLYDGKDWEVVIRSFQRRDGSMGMVAEPVIPKQRHSPESIREAATRSWLKEERPKQASLPQIAHALRVPVEQVERWVLDAPKGTNLFKHCRNKQAQAVQRAGHSNDGDADAPQD